jgi:predicted MFS family arabinose efflux permease
MGSISRGWRVVIAYSAVAAATQVLWLTYAPIDTSSAHHYGVSTGAIGWLAEIFPLLYVVLALPTGRLLDRSFRPTLAGGGALMAAGGLLRLVDPGSFAWAMAGQSAVAVAQPVVLNAVSKLAGDYLPEPERAAGIAVGASAGFAGMLFALVAGPTIGGGGHIERLLIVEAVLGVAAAAALAWALRAPGEAEGSGESVAADAGLARQLWAQPQMRTMAGLVFVGFGVFIALTTWLQALLEPAGVGEGGAAALLIGMLVSGMVGCAVLPPLVERRDAGRTFMRAAAFTAILGPAALGLLTWVPVRAVVLVAMGFVLLPALPIVLTSAERLAGVGAAGTAAAIVWLAGNLGGLVVAVVVQALVHHPLPAFLAMAALSLPALALAGRFDPPPAPLSGRPRSP